MPAPTSPLEAKEAPEAPDETVPKAAGRERREAERLIADWEDETRRLSHVLALLTLNTGEMATEKWACRFIVALRPAVEDCTLLFYGAGFAALMELPQKPDHSVPMVEQLPARYVPVFTRGCIEATVRGVPIRLQGGRARRRTEGALPGSIHPLEPQYVPATPLRARRLQLPRDLNRGRAAEVW
jgi:hypothetical protein